MTTKIHRACAADGCAIISEGTLKPAHILPKLLDALKELAPDAHQQLTMPGAGFSVIPAYALEDETSDWWDDGHADDALAMLFDALNEHAPEGFSFEASQGDGSSYGFWKIEEI